VCHAHARSRCRHPHRPGAPGARFDRYDPDLHEGEPGTTLVGLAVFFTAGFNNTPFYPSKADLQSSLTIYNASSSHYTLTVMTYVALVIPVVLAYIAYVWYLMDAKKVGAEDLNDTKAY